MGFQNLQNFEMFHIFFIEVSMENRGKIRTVSHGKDATFATHFFYQ